MAHIQCCLVEFFQKVRFGKRSGKKPEMVCCFFRFRDQEVLKFPIFAKNETKIHKLASLRQSGFSFQRKTQEFKDFQIPAKSKSSDHFRFLPAPFSKAEDPFA
jgi:hypothetical protein